MTIRQNGSVYSVETDDKTYQYWLFGIGLLPLHPKPNFAKEFFIRSALKREIFGHKVMEERLKTEK